MLLIDLFGGLWHGVALGFPCGYCCSFVCCLTDDYHKFSSSFQVRNVRTFNFVYKKIHGGLFSLPNQLAKKF